MQTPAHVSVQTLLVAADMGARCHFSGRLPLSSPARAFIYIYIFRAYFCAFKADLNSVFVSLTVFATDDNQSVRHNSAAAVEQPFISCAAPHSHFE